MTLHPDYINELCKHFAGDIRENLASRILDAYPALIEGKIGRPN
jgi:hypothetical protein